jgi:dimethylaniline monooxygenase (N-oxide forming)
MYQITANTKCSRESSIGGTFKYRSYENAELVSSKQLTTFSDFRLPLDSPDHISLPDYVEYLKSYIDHFGLWKHINLDCRVDSIKPHPQDSKSRYRVTYSRRKDGPGAAVEPEAFDCSHLAICTGLHVQPNIPQIPGIEFLQGDAFHSSLYKDRSQLQDHDILLLGCGETAMDIAYEAIKAPARSVTMCFRTGFLSFPKVLNRFRVFGKTFGGRLPIDGLITNLFETAYVHHKIRESRMRSIISDRVIKKVMWFLTGTQEGCNQHVGALPNEMLGRSYVFLNKSHRAMPYLNRPYKQKQPLLDFIGNEYMDPPEDAQSDRFVDTCTFPERLDETGRVVFKPRPDRKDWQRLKDKVVRPSLIIYATGYRQEFSWLSPGLPRAGEANVRNIIKAGHPDVGFIGFVRPGVGAIPPIAEQQAMWWTALTLGKMQEPTRAGHYKLLTKNNARIEYGVDYSTYMSVLAQDFGGAPSLLELWRLHGFTILLVYCFGASFVSFYRLTGPFASSMAPEITKTELLDTVMRRGLTGNFFFGVVPMLFYGILNGVSYMLEKLGVLSQERPAVEVDRRP